ncbi:centrosomal protein of 295 kDa isoform X4 [Cynoglossus semilaevis]|uniref:Centrosomal protein 295 n=1 Tax=Cynoglossus semilaevis TaxID=244447 RepID=A0A3P8V9P5_CYNSE|nr:centrosomal protein of 295 kDa isoform X4 [Cynoglossus semilaevis]
MKRKLAKIRLSPNEEARIIKEENERRRKLRIQQVREQQRHIALSIRQAVEQRRQHELEQLGKDLQLEWEQQQKEKLETIQRLYQESLQLLGQGHKDAKENEPDLAAIAQREAENHAKAEQRFQEALKELKLQRLKDQERQSKVIDARKKALLTEKDRSAKVASLPPPPPHPIENIDLKKPHIVKKTDVSAFAATHYHMPERTVDREADTLQLCARTEAEVKEKRLQDLQREETIRREEQLEKARHRGRQALRREQLVQDRQRLLVELEHLQQTDLLRRRQQVSQMPPQIFQPLYKRQEMRDDFQREMEFAFEDMYTGERRVKGDLVVQLAPEPLPASSTGSQDQELDVTLDEVTTPGTIGTSHDAKVDTEQTEMKTSAQIEKNKHAPRHALRKLLDRIRNQRNQWTELSSPVSSADSPSTISDKIPERDTSIESGSLNSEEKKRPPVNELESDHSAVELETTDPSSGTHSQPPDEFAKRIEEFEEERKKREEDLEWKKQQQVDLLQELEEQKVKLEQMLLEAQQERERLKTAVNQEETIYKQQSDQGWDVTLVCPGQPSELDPPADENDHNRRIREYKQWLLQQNRVHQRSVEVARQRLEEYQRTLQTRHNMTSMSLLPQSAVTNLELCYRPLHISQSVQPPAFQDTFTSPKPSHIHHEAQSSTNAYLKESAVQTLPFHLQGSQILPGELESSSRVSRVHGPELTACLSENIMEKVTEHLPERVKLTSPTIQTQPHKAFPATVPLHPHPPNDLSQGSGPSIRYSPALPSDQSTCIMPGPTVDDMERCKSELQDIQRCVCEQSEVLQQRQPLRPDLEMEQMRQQRETLQALINTDTKSSLKADAGGQVSENIRQTRLRLLATLLKAVEESNGGTLSHLEEPQQNDCFSEGLPCDKETDLIVETSSTAGPATPSSYLSGFLPPARAAKPPLTRMRLGITAMKTNQHELSVIPEVQTPVDRSRFTGLENFEKGVDWDLQDESGLSVARDRTLHTPSVSSGDQQTAEKSSSSSTSSYLIWRERLLTGAWTSPESSEPDSLRKKISSTSSDSSGPDVSGPSITKCRSPQEVTGSTEHSPHRPPESDGFSSSTLSTGSYVTTDIEQNTDKPSVRPGEKQGEVNDVWSLSGQRIIVNDTLSAAGFSHVTEENLEEDQPHVSLKQMSAAAHPSSFNKETSAAHQSGYFVKEHLMTSQPDPMVENTLAYGPPGSFGVDSLTGGHPHSVVEETLAAGLHNLIVEDTSADGGPGSFEETLASHPSVFKEMSTADRPDSIITDTSAADHSSSHVQDQLDHAHPDAPAVESLFNESNIQRIIDKYMKELNFSLSTAGRSTDSEDSSATESGSSVLQPSPAKSPEKKDDNADSRQTLLPPTAETQTQHELSRATDPVLEQSSQAEDSFRPLIGQLADQSSFLAVDSAMEQLVGQPSAQSSMIGQLPSGWDSTLSRMFGRLSHQFSCGHDFYSSQRSGPVLAEQSTTWMDEGREEGQMRPLAAEPDTDHNGGVSVNPGVSAETCSPSYPALPPEASTPSTCLPGEDHHPEQQIRQNQSSTTELCPERTGVFPDSNSFHPLLAEVTHNETADPSVTFHLLEHKGSDLPEDEVNWESSVSRPSEESEPNTDVSVESESSPERPREESSLQEMSPYQPQESVLDMEDTLGTDVEITALNLSNLKMCYDDGDPENPQTLHAASDACTEGMNTLPSELERELPFLENILDVSGKKGILEQSEITLLSVTDSTLQDQETTVTDDEPLEDQDQVEESQEAEAQTQPVMSLEFQWNQDRGLQQLNQQKYRALLQRSSQRLQDIKDKRAQVKTSKIRDVKPDICEPENKPEPQQKNVSEGGRAEQQDQVQKPPPVSDCRPKTTVELKILTPEKRKHNISEMYQRTQRLYEQLEEVKQQKTIRTRQEASAKNRLKAMEFHKKTLQKLRAKQTKK